MKTFFQIFLRCGKGIFAEKNKELNGAWPLQALFDHLAPLCFMAALQG
jgi:hypothetical protein